VIAKASARYYKYCIVGRMGNETGMAYLGYYCNISLERLREVFNESRRFPFSKENQEPYI
jgi:hypothetical protein